MKLALLMIVPLLALSEANAACETPAKGIAEAVFRTRFEGNDAFGPEGIKISSKSKSYGFKVVATARVCDYHRGANVIWCRTMTHKMKFNQACQAL